MDTLTAEEAGVMKFREEVLIVLEGENYTLKIDEENKTITIFCPSKLSQVIRALRDRRLPSSWIVHLIFSDRPIEIDTVNHPPHYGGEDNPYEAIKVIEAWELDFHLGNSVKYICRAGKKNPEPLEDLEKALWYLKRRIKREKQRLGIKD